MKTLKVIRKPREILSVPMMVKRTVENYPDSIAMQILTPEGLKKWSYRELLQLIKTRSGEMKDRGIRKGDRVALYGPNSPEWIITYLAIQWAGAICVPLDRRLSHREVHYLIKDSGSKILYASPSETREEIEISTPLLIPETILKGKEVESAELSLEDPAVILYTSGTTGTPKGIVLSHMNLASNVEMGYQAMEFYPEEVFYALLPLHHVFAQTIAMLAPLSTGSTITIARSFKSKEITEDCKESKPVIFPVVPLILEKFIEGIERELSKLNKTKKAAFGMLNGMATLFNKIKKGSGTRFYTTIREGLGLENLRYLISGGAALPYWISGRFEKWGFPILQAYGLTETSPGISINPPNSPRNKSVGLPLPGLEVKILNPDIDGVGEIAVRGPSVFKQYWRSKESTKEKFEGDWFKTGDVGYFDSDSYLYVTGRKKSVIVTKGGKNIYPEEIENYLSQSPLIAEVLVLYQTNPNTQKRELNSIIYPNYEEIDNYCEKHNIEVLDPHKILTEEIKRLNKKLTDYKRVRRIKLRDEEFPKTTTEKIKRYLFEEEGMEI
ncbi:MAG: AMP-binding protein [candidate division WOR-3 bacterium]|nr:AMP-binding protein [candidate division WOR-3 bacterium]